MAKPRVLALSYLFPNGAMRNYGIFVRKRLAALQNYAEIRVISPIAWSPVHGRLKRYQAQAEVAEVESYDGLEVHHPRFFSIPKYLKAMEAVFYRLAVARVMRGALRSFDFDLIDVHWTYPDLPAAVWLARKYQKKLMLTVRGAEAFYSQGDWLRSRMVTHGFRCADRIICLSRGLKERTDSLIGTTEKSFVVRNGVDTQVFNYLPKAEARQRLGLDSQETIIISVGSLIRGKGFDLLIRSFAALLNESKGPGLRLYILGSQGPAGDYRSKLTQLVRRLGLNGRVVFYGQVENADLREWYNAADVFCLASRSEGSPNVLTEALACGCPCVATDVGAVREILSMDDGLGLCIPPDDLDILVRGIKDVQNLPLDRKSRAEIMKRFSWDWCARNVLTHYQALLDLDSPERHC